MNLGDRKNLGIPEVFPLRNGKGTKRAIKFSYSKLRK